MSEQNVQLTKRFFEQMCNKRELSLADQLFSLTHTYHDPGSPWVGTGPQGMKDLIGTYHRGVPEAHWHVNAIAQTSDVVVTRWTGTGTHTGELLGIPPTGKSVKVDGIWIHKIANGKIVESWNCWDTLGMMQQLGVIPSVGGMRSAA